MSITDPTELVEQFKKSGEFDRLRRELLQQFRNHDSIDTFMSRVQDIVQERLREDDRLGYLPPEAVHAELMQDMDRFPLVQRAVADLPALTDPAFSASVHRSLARLLSDGPDSININGKRPGHKPDTAEDADGDIDMDDSDRSASDSGSSDEEQEQEQEQEQEHVHEDEHNHEREHEREREDVDIPDDVPQDDRTRQPPPDTDAEKRPSLVNGSDEPPKSEP